MSESVIDINAAVKLADLKLSSELQLEPLDAREKAVATEDSVSEGEQNGWQRRTVIKTALLIGGGAVANTAVASRAEKAMSNRLPAGPPTLEWITSYKPGIHKEVMFFFPGTGDLQSSKEARILRNRAQIRNVPLAAIKMSHEHTDEDQLVDLLINNLSDALPEYLSEVGRSLGGIIGLFVVAKAAKIMNKKIGRFSMISSPSSLHDGNMGSFGGALDAYTPDWNVLNYDGKFIACYGQQIQENGYLPAVSNFIRAQRAVKHGEDWNALRSEVHMLRNTDVKSHASFSLLSDVTERGVTSGSYVSARHPRTDPTVHDTNAYRTLRPIMNRLCIPFPWIHGDYAGHAKMLQSTIALNPYFQKADPLIRNPD